MIWRKKVWRPGPLAARTDKALLTSEDVDAFMSAADERPYQQLMKSIDALCDELALTNPIRVAEFRKSFKWLRQQAKRRGLPWGN